MVGLLISLLVRKVKEVIKWCWGCGEWPLVPYVDYLGERNFRCFEDKELTTAEISTRFLTLLYQWAGVLNIPQVSSMSQFVDFCSYFSL
jgi:hypothetical protein